MFISYRRATSWPLALLIRNTLEGRGYDVFVDVAHLGRGNFRERVLREIDDRAHVVVVLQPATVFDAARSESDWMQLEIAHAFSVGRNVVPAMELGFRFDINGPLPSGIAGLAHMNGVEFPPGYFDAAMERLADTFLAPLTTSAVDADTSSSPLEEDAPQARPAASDQDARGVSRAAVPPVGIDLLARLGTSVVDARRGVARLHPEVIGALGLEYWDAIRVTGARSTVALVGPAPQPSAPGTAILDETAMVNAGVVDGSTVGISAAPVVAARSVELAGSRLAVKALPPETLRAALIGKVLLPGDTLSLLPQDVAPVPGADAAGARRELAAALGGTWTTELVTVTAAQAPPDADPFSALVVAPTTTVRWRDGASTSGPGRYP
ncbi:TIR domain-containing protein [Actinomycetospora aeridis]|uniref:TIR domain-containing protein n=1 Tax=Actinomycetospora aeridis TaxID=3129231 RepID=A0ABU8NCK0_9PSEU